MQNKRSGEYCYNGHKINVGRSFYRAEAFQGKCPGGKAERGGEQAQEKHVERIDRLEKLFRFKIDAFIQNNGQHEDKAPEEYGPGGCEASPARRGQLAGQNGVNGPGKRCQQGKQIAKRAHFEGSAIK